MSFEEWLIALRAEFISVDIGFTNYFDNVDSDCWRVYFDAGCTPKDAMEEDLSCA